MGPMGHKNMGFGHPVSWPAKLSGWLNHSYPCKGRGHHVINAAEGGKGGNFYAMKLNSWLRSGHGAAQADLVIAELAGNDVQVKAQRDGAAGNLDRGGQVQYFTEL